MEGMVTEKYKRKLDDFLVKNGWEIIEQDDDYISYGKKDNIGISLDLSRGTIVLVGESGDFKEFYYNNDILYAFLGYMIHHRYLCIDYKGGDNL
jgi:hypothetical protein